MASVHHLNEQQQCCMMELGIGQPSPKQQMMWTAEGMSIINGDHMWQKCDAPSESEMFETCCYQMWAAYGWHLRICGI
jgi:hypothetical protein